MLNPRAKTGGVGLLSKISSEASASYDGPTAATAATASGNDSPTVGKSIPIIAGGARPKGEVIWCRTRTGKNNECRGDIAVCFGRNAFGRPLNLSALALDGTDLYIRKGGVALDPPNAVRFYDGTQTSADPLIALVEGAAYTPAWKGYVYAVIEDVLLADGEYRAEFTDNGTETTTSALSCSPDLVGIDLLYEAGSGLYYGLKDPWSGASEVVTSDGCQIINSRPIIQVGNKTGLFGKLKDGYRFYAANLFPVKCSPYVAVVGHFKSADGDWLSSYTAIIDPSTGEMIGGANNYTAGVALANDLTGIISDPTGNADSVKYTVSYLLPGKTGKTFAVARKFDRTDCAVSTFGIGNHNSNPSLAATLGPANNVAAQIFDFTQSELNYTSNFTIAVNSVRPGEGRLLYEDEHYEIYWAYYYGDHNGAATSVDYSEWTQDVFLVSEPIASGFYPSYIGASQIRYVTAKGWSLKDLPFFDEFIYLKEVLLEHAELAGVRTVAETTTVYRFWHSETGVAIQSTAEIVLPSGFEYTGLSYDAATDTVLVSAGPSGASLLNSRVYSVSPLGLVSYVETGSQNLRLVNYNNGIPFGGYAPLQNANASQISMIDTVSGDVTSLYSGTAPTGDPTVDLSRNVISLPTVDGRTSYAASQVTANDIALSDLITDICALKGYSSGDLVFEGFTGLVARGMTISSTTRVSDLLNRMGQLYGFVFAETDGKLKFRRRRAADGSVTPDVTLTEDDLLENEANITIQRQAATTVLGSLGLTWLDPDRDYESNNVLARRITGVLSGSAGTRDEDISLPLAIDQATARTLLFQSFYAMAEAETRVKFSVGPEHLRIEPGDLVEVTVGGATRLVQARRVTHQAGINTLEIEADTFMAQATPTIGSAGGNTSSPSVGAISGRYIHLDIPLVLETDYPGAGSVRQYHGLTTFDAEGWGGADLYTSANGSIYVKSFEYDAQPMSIGVAQNALGDCPQTYSIDETAQLVIKVTAGDPDNFATVTYAEMMSGLTLCAYGRPGAWELMSFETVTDNGDGTLTLSNLQRGLFGTHQVYYPAGTGDYPAGLDQVHQAGDYICLLDNAKLRSTVRPQGDIGKTDRYAVVTADVDITAAVKPFYAMPGISMRPPPVANVIVEHVAGSDDLTITFDATTPIPHTWEDTGAAGVMPENYQYYIYISTTAGNFDLTLTYPTTSGTWTDYGTELGATSKAYEEITSVSVEVISSEWGESFTTYATEIREA